MPSGGGAWGRRLSPQLRSAAERQRSSAAKIYPRRVAATGALWCCWRFGHVIQETSPDKGITVYHLDKAGNRTNEVDARGIVTLRTFDKLNRVTAQTFPASSGENITFSYDSTNGGNFGIGRLTGYTDETGSTTLKYNERGDMVSTTRTISGQSYTTSYAYNIADNVTNIVYPSGHVISLGRDGQGRISSVTYRLSVGGVATVLASNILYAPFGRLSGLLYGNGLVRSNSYDLDYRLTGLTTQNGGVHIQNLGYGYNAVNNITAITDNLAPGNSQSFGYDNDCPVRHRAELHGLKEISRPFTQGVTPRPAPFKLPPPCPVTAQNCSVICSRPRRVRFI